MSAKTTKFEITLNTRLVGKVTHIVFAETLEAAQERALRAHPGGVVLQGVRSWK